jgi:tetratricopeptide repeat protein 30
MWFLMHQGNYEFGISRVIKSLEPYQAKLGTDTWFYAKRCFLSLAEGLAKHMIAFKESSWGEVLAFLTEAERCGRDIPAAFGGSAGAAGSSGRGAGEGHTVAAEARMLHRMFLQLRDG